MEVWVGVECGVSSRTVISLIVLATWKHGQAMITYHRARSHDAHPDRFCKSWKVSHSM